MQLQKIALFLLAEAGQEKYPFGIDVFTLSRIQGKLYWAANDIMHPIAHNFALFSKECELKIIAREYEKILKKYPAAINKNSIDICKLVKIHPNSLEEVIYYHNIKERYAVINHNNSKEYAFLIDFKEEDLL